LKRIVLLLLTLLIFTSCSREIGQFSIISTLEVDHSVIYESIGEVEGKDTEYIIIFFPTGLPKIDKAVSNALYDYDAIYLKNAIATYQEFYIPYLFGFLQFKVVGEAWVETEFKKEIKKGSKVFDPITGKLIID